LSRSLKIAIMAHALLLEQAIMSSTNDPNANDDD